ncbi:MAG: outer membrane protein assembly factor BamD [Candidatus Zixiibacteriota bacterium]
MTKLSHSIQVLLLVGAAMIMFAGCGGKTTLVSQQPDELFKIGKEKYDHKKYLGAIEAFQSVIYNFPGNSIVDTAQYYLALSYYGNKDYALGGVEFNRLLVNYPASVYAPHAQFMKAVCAFESTPRSSGLDQTELEDAIRQFEEFLVDRPESVLAPDVKKYLVLARTRMAQKYYNSGVVYSNTGAADAAKRYYQKVADDYTDTEYAPLAIFNIAREEYKQRHFDEARQKFEGFQKAFPDHALTPKAADLAVTSAFKSGEESFRKGDMAAAREKFERFVKDYSQDKRVKKADEYLQKIGERVLSDSTGVKTDS